MEPYSFADFEAGKRPPKGWDCADAVADGWGKKELDAYMRAMVVPPDEWREWLKEAYPEVYASITAAPKPAGKPVTPTSAGPVQQMKPAEQAKPQSTTVTNIRTRITTSAVPLILDRQDPMPSARVLIADKYMRGINRSLHHYRGVFYEWNGAQYREVDKDATNAVIWAFLERAWCTTKEGDVPFQPNTSRVGNVYEALEAACNLPADTDAPVWLENDGNRPPANEFLPVKNGLLHLPTGDLYPPTPEYFCLNSASVEYNPDAPVPVEWLRFLDQIWPGDTQSIETLQDVFGYFLAFDTSQQKIILVVGPKRSGKGTISRILTGLLGQTSVASPTLAGIATNFGLAPLIGKSLAIIGDARLSSRADQAVISERLLSISGEDSLTIDRKYLSSWTGRLGARFMVMTNELPRLADASGALASRFIVLTMEQSFYGKEDRALGNRLLGEMPGILNWALVGHRRLRERGHFLQPESARDAIDELETLGSPVAAFVKERCQVAPGLRCESLQMFNAWKGWCEANGRREPGTAASFGRDLRAAVPGLKMSQPRIGRQRIRSYEGVAVAAMAGRPEPPDDW